MARKRKSEFTANQSSSRKRGRPRLPKQLNKDSKSIEDKKDTNGAAVVDMATEDPPKMVTRRSARKSTESNVEQPKVDPSGLTEPLLETNPDGGEYDDATMVEHKDITADHKKASYDTTSESPSVSGRDTPVHLPPASQKIQLNESETDTFAPASKKAPIISKRSTRKRPKVTEHVKDGKIKKNDNRKIVNGKTLRTKQTNGLPRNVNGTVAPKDMTAVEFFARVQTTKGIVEVPVALDGLSEEVELIHQYAQWINGDGAEDVTYKMFKSIFGLAKKA